jgi:CBS domain-containing protein
MKSTRTIKEAVIRRYPEIGLEESLGDAIKLMAKNNCSALVVKEGGVLFGLVTITDVMHSLVHHQDLQDTKISSFMTKCELISSEGTKNACAQLDEEQDVLSALKVMHQAGVNHLLVSRGESKPVGVVSALEIIRLLGK